MKNKTALLVSTGFLVLEFISASGCKRQSSEPAAVPAPPPAAADANAMAPATNTLEDAKKTEAPADPKIVQMTTATYQNKLKDLDKRAEKLERLNENYRDDEESGKQEIRLRVDDFRKKREIFESSLKGVKAEPTATEWKETEADLQKQWTIVEQAFSELEATNESDYQGLK